MVVLQVRAGGWLFRQRPCRLYRLHRDLLPAAHTGQDWPHHHRLVPRQEHLHKLARVFLHRGHALLNNFWI